MSPACVLLPLLLGAAAAAPPALRPSKEELTRCLAQVVSDMLTLGQAQHGPCMALLHRELHGCGAADANLEKREAAETRSGQEDETGKAHESTVREQAVQEQLHSRLRQEDAQEDGQKSGARGAFGGPWWLRLEGTGGTQKRVAEQARDEETEKDVKVLGDTHSLWLGSEAEQRGEPSPPHHVYQPPAEAQQEEKEAAREKAEHEVERLEHVREELKKATEVLGEELRREG